MTDTVWGRGMSTRTEAAPHLPRTAVGVFAVAAGAGVDAEGHVQRPSRQKDRADRLGKSCRCGHDGRLWEAFGLQQRLARGMKEITPAPTAEPCHVRAKGSHIPVAM